MKLFVSILLITLLACSKKTNTADHGNIPSNSSTCYLSPGSAFCEQIMSKTRSEFFPVFQNINAPNRSDVIHLVDVLQRTGINDTLIVQYNITGNALTDTSGYAFFLKERAIPLLFRHSFENIYQFVPDFESHFSPFFLFYVKFSAQFPLGTRIDFIYQLQIDRYYHYQIM